ncbi:CHAT domain protein [Tautonia plasticadhaerens]|uniref:CHAT domain protein n=1 Tax=Tautonia plasticadhaerens TaxID=2527974 RepID=A0A518GXZ2_9BACT|nr:CHAT domain protein [Tautonia plasticadhaerens]
MIVLPSAAMAGVPVEALLAAGPEWAKQFVVSYAPSGSMFAMLVEPQGQEESGGPKLLALGDPTYPLAEPDAEPPTPPDHGIAILAVDPSANADLFGIKVGDALLAYNGVVLNSGADLKTVPAEEGATRIPVKLWRNGEVREIEVAAGELGINHDPSRPAAEVVLAQRAAGEVLKPLTRGESLARLPGTRREVELISGLFPDGHATILLGERATEPAVQGLARSGALKGLRYLHFAAHGKTNPHVAMSSAIRLAPEPDGSAEPLAMEADGSITAEQIVNTWDLDADLVVLSACETGLGRYAGGEGYLGFSQALFVRGPGAWS